MKLPNHIHTLQFRLTAGFAAVLAGTLFVVSGWSAISTRAAIEDYGLQVEQFRTDRTSDLVRDVFNLDRDFRQVQFSLEQIGRFIPRRIAIVDENGTVLADSRGWPEKPDGGFFTQKERFDESKHLGSATIDLGGGYFVKMVLYDDEEGLPPDLASFSFGEWPEGGERSGPFGFPRSWGNAAGPSRWFDEEALESVTAFNVDEDDSAPIDIIEQAVSELAAEPQLTALEESFQQSIIIAGGAGLIAGVLLVALFARGALYPVRSLSKAAQQLGSGDFEQRVDEDRKDELGNLARTFNSMAEDLQDAEAQRRKMTADIAHELRNPLTNIRGYLEAIKDGIVKPDDAAIDTLHGETLHLSRLVDDLQLLAIADAGGLRLYTTTSYMSEFAERAVNAAMPRAMERDIDLSIEVDTDTPLVDLDPTRFTQVVSNLLDNALSHSKTGGNVFVEVRSGMIDATWCATLRITNDGTAIPADDLERIFDQFYRVDPSRSRSTGGAGLGLTIVKRIVEAHGGSVAVESNDHATTFTVSVPESSEVIPDESMPDGPEHEVQEDYRQ